MAEPEEVLIDAAHGVATHLQRLWLRRSSQSGPPCAESLDHHRRRLQLLVAAVFDAELPIRVSQSPARPTLLSRLLRRLPSELVDLGALPGTDGAHLYLPPALPGHGAQASRLFRAMALQQSGRALRLRKWVGRLPAAGIVQDLFLLSEAVAADRQVARELPGIASDVLALRSTALTGRPHLSQLTHAERAVEELHRQLLRAVPGCERLVPPAPTPDDSLCWAMETEALVCRGDARYRALPRNMWWGRLYPPPLDATQAEATMTDDDGAQEPRVGRMARRPEVREAALDEDDEDSGPWMIQTDDPHQHAEDPHGLRRPQDQDGDTDANDLGDSLAELPEARLVTTPNPAREVLVSDDSPGQRAAAPGAALSPAGIAYPEWDYRLGAYQRPGATIRPWPLEVGPPAWATEVLGRHAVLLREVRRRFECLRPRREWLRRQVDGDEVDIDAYVETYADRRAGGHVDDRLYSRVRPARRDIAIVLLVDVSGSTDAWVSGHQRIIDVEKEALLIVSVALETLGDPHAIVAFSGHGPDAVRVGYVREFGQQDQRLVRRRIAGLGPERYTRTGAALRHATALLAARGEAHRLLLLLSDGKPNDEDRYEGRHGVEDTKQAVREAQLLGIHSFCLTVDRHAPSYLPAVYGPTGYTVLRNPGRLPLVLVELLTRLLR